MTVRSLKSLAILAPLLAATAAPAQPAPPPAPAPASATHTDDYVQRRIDALHRRLKITPDQEAAFQKFASQMSANADQMHTAYETRRADAASMTAIDNLKTYADLEEARAREARGLIDPFQALYAQLAPDQQKTADAIFREQAERAGRRRRG